MKISDSIIKRIRAFAGDAILWPDKERQWEKAIPVLRREIPELLSLGIYSPEDRTGPAIWLRCAIAGKIPKFAVTDDQAPVIYLPGASRQDLRAGEDCPQELISLVELQFRGTIWSQDNGKDWTIMAYLVSDKGGLGLDVAQDAETQKAMQNALTPLLQEDVEELKCKKLDADFFNSLLTGGDPYRDLLNWLNEGEQYKQTLSAEQWQAFCGNCKSLFGFDPVKDGPLVAMEYLVSVGDTKPKKSSWQKVWDRYCDAANRFPSLPNQIRKLSAPNETIFWAESDGKFDRYPQWNSDMEEKLQNEFQTIRQLTEKNARIKLHELEEQHGRRRELIWAGLGEANYTLMLKDLAQISRLTEQSLATGSLPEIEKRYSEQLWHADRAMLELLENINSNEDLDLISGILDIIYIPWLDSSARYLQTIGLSQANQKRVSKTYDNVEAVLFVDGLRFDCAKMLSLKMIADGFIIEEEPRWAGLPTITATCKPILVEAMIDASRQKKDVAKYEALSSIEFKKTLEQSNWQVLGRDSTIPAPVRKDGKPVQKLWLEYGNLDELGHSQHWKIAKYLDSALNDIRNTIKALIKAGWESVQIVSDHGWLLSPMGLPKTDLPACLSQNKWARFAIIKEGANTEESHHPWYWDREKQIAFAGGISCYRSGMKYTHGGLSIQECLLLDLRIKKPNGTEASPVIKINEIKWINMRCSIAIEGIGNNMFFDIRTTPGDAKGSIVNIVKPIKNDLATSVLVENENLLGVKAYIVILDQDGRILAQVQTTIGGGTDDSTR